MYTNVIGLDNFCVSQISYVYHRYLVYFKDRLVSSVTRHFQDMSMSCFMYD